MTPVRSSCPPKKPENPIVSTTRAVGVGGGALPRRERHVAGDSHACFPTWQSIDAQHGISMFPVNGINNNPLMKGCAATKIA